MGTRSNSMLWARQSNVMAAAATALIALLVLIGWEFNLEVLKRIVPGFVAMNPITAVAFLLAALSITLFSRRKSHDRIRYRLLIALGCAWIVASIGLAKLITVFGGPDLSLDRWLFAS